MKKILIGIILGICIGITGFVAYLFVQVDKQFNADHVTITQIVGYLNQQIVSQQKAAAPVSVKK